MKEISSASNHSGVHGVKSNRYQQSRLLNETWALVNKVVKPNIKFKTHHNVRYSQDDFLKLITFAGINHDFAEGTSRYFNLASKKGCPDADTVLYHLKKFDERELIGIFDSIIDEILALAKGKGALSGKVDVAIDATEDLYYGDKTDPMVVGTKPQKGTSRAYRYATLTIVEPGCRFTVKVIPMDKSTLKSEVVYQLLQYAKERISIGTVYLDRGFYSADVILALNSMGIPFVMPAVLNKNAIRLMRGHEAPKILPIRIGDKEKKASANLVIAMGKEMEKRGFITNIDVDRRRTRELVHLYSKRWGIETSYRVKKEFRAKTTSKNYVIRLFYFMYSVCLYNLWQLVNIAIKMIIEWAMDKPSLVSAKVFGRGLFLIFKEMATGPPTKFISS